MNKEDKRIERLLAYLEQQIKHGEIERMQTTERLDTHRNILSSMRTILKSEGYKSSGKRQPNSPVGPLELTCECGHTWADHDDHGCLWRQCQCFLPGERK